MQNIEITGDFLKNLDLFLKCPVMIISDNQRDLIYANSYFNQDFNEIGIEASITRIIDKTSSQNQSQFEISFMKLDDIELVYDVKTMPIKFENQLSTIFVLSTSTDEYSLKQKIAKVGLGLLQILRNVDISESTNKTLNLVLEESIKVFSLDFLGSVFVVQNGKFQIINQVGFNREIIDFQLPIKDSFIFNETQGKMDQVVIINHIEQRFNIIPFKNQEGREVKIKSSLVTPLYYKDELFGMINIDSEEDEIFNEEDIELMKFIRDNVQVILSNQLSFLEKKSKSFIDTMTNLYNKNYLNEQVINIIERSKRYEETFSLVVIDIDDLKKINDQYGHIMGDHFINTVAYKLQTSSRNSDIIARFGGDEFVAIYLMSDKIEIMKKLENLSIETDFIEEKEISNFKITFSYGISVFPTDGDTYYELLNIADARMYQSKKEKKAQ